MPPLIIRIHQSTIEQLLQIPLRVFSIFTRERLDDRNPLFHIFNPRLPCCKSIITLSLFLVDVLLAKWAFSLAFLSAAPVLLFLQPLFDGEVEDAFERALEEP